MERRKLLITTKTYPSISTKYRETVCTAGVLLDDQEKPLGVFSPLPPASRPLPFPR